MPARPMIAVTAAAGLIDAIQARGGDADRIRSVGHVRSAVAKTDAFIPCSAFARLLNVAARELHDDCFGLHFGERYQPKAVGPLAYAVLNSATVAAAIHNTRAVPPAPQPGRPRVGGRSGAVRVPPPRVGRPRYGGPAAARRVQHG